MVKTASARSRLGVVCCITVAQVAATQMTARVQRHLDAPFSIMWMHAALMVLCLPVGWYLRRGAPTVAPPRDIAAFLGLYVGANYAFVRALGAAPPSVVATVFAAAPAVVAALSRVRLGEPLTARRLAAVLGCSAGVALVAGGALEAPGTRAAAGVGFACVAVACAAAYKVEFGARFRDTPPAFALDFVGRVGAAAALAGAPIAAALALRGVEPPPRVWTRADVAIVLGGGLVDVAYNALIALGLSIAAPVFVATGTILAIPANGLVDALADGDAPDAAQAAGAVIICCAFGILASERPRPRPLRTEPPPDEAPLAAAAAV